MTLGVILDMPVLFLSFRTNLSTSKESMPAVNKLSVSPIADVFLTECTLSLTNFNTLGISFHFIEISTSSPLHEICRFI